MLQKLYMILLAVSTVAMAQGPAYIRNINSNKVLDVEGASVNPNTDILLSERNGGNSQKWSFDKGYLFNKNSGLVLEVPWGGEAGTTLVQNSQVQWRERQQWKYDDQHRIVSIYDPGLCVWGGDFTATGGKAIVDHCRDDDNTQQWMFDRA
ncbi:carbohydrate-binding module family 13 protein [Macrolepiota fuliginosa MF-IS2]|uniref:Carbohydrate-binding module family 13 protein n=1 Tax=Macrolepiota fuliginosa MF-IS2 TaxID=1400762 RepID=A0A9P5X462_9AGAR|nr:carbohydrate-binding module family 13 protein [Macrolepiota fuliginosa MF-IS2]